MFRKKFRLMNPSDRFTKPTSESSGRNVFSHLKTMTTPIVVLFVACFVLSSVTSSGYMPGQFDGCVYSCSQELHECMEPCKDPARADCKTTFEAAEQAAIDAEDRDALVQALREHQDCYNDAKCPQDEEDACADAYFECLEENAPPMWP